MAWNTILWDAFMSVKLRWVLFLAVMILNFFAFYQDPSRYTTEPVCIFNSPCKWYNYLAGMGTFTLDVFTFIGLWYTISPQWLRDFLPEFWYIPFVILGYAIITQITIDSPNYVDNKDVLESPPPYLWQHNWRIYLYGIILILDIIIFIQLYLDTGYHDYSQNFKVFDIAIKNRFGGWQKDNYIQFIFSWLAIIGIIVDINALKEVYLFNACEYNLPISWNY